MTEKKRVNVDMKQYGMFLALIAIYVIFAIMTGGKNLSPMNINNLIMQNGYVVILAIGMLLCVLTGIDIFPIVGLTISVPIIGSVLTGIIVSRGANFVNDLFTKLKGGNK